MAVNSRLINYTSACGNILPKCQSGPCEAAHLTTLAQHVQRSTWWKTHTAKKVSNCIKPRHFPKDKEMTAKVYALSSEQMNHLCVIYVKQVGIEIN